jgi:periplasmic divalent cation tolerance protein
MSAEKETDYGVAFVSAPPDRAEEMARQIVREKLAAAAQVLAPMSSVYWWNGALRTEPERLILLKTRRSRLADLEALLRRIHPYEIPELTFVDFAGSAAPYRKWMRDILGGTGS